MAGKYIKNSTLACLTKKLSVTYRCMMAHSFRLDVGKCFVIVSFQKSKMADYFGGKIYKNSTLTCIANKLSITYGRMMAHSFRLDVGKILLIVSFQKFKMADHFGGKIYNKFNFNMNCKKLSITAVRMVAHYFHLYIGKCLLIVSF